MGPPAPPAPGRLADRRDGGGEGQGPARPSCVPPRAGGVHRPRARILLRRRRRRGARRSAGGHDVGVLVARPPDRVRGRVRGLGPGPRRARGARLRRDPPRCLPSPGGPGTGRAAGRPVHGPPPDPPLLLGKPRPGRGRAPPRPPPVPAGDAEPRDAGRALHLVQRRRDPPGRRGGDPGRRRPDLARDPGPRGRGRPSSTSSSGSISATSSRSGGGPGAPPRRSSGRTRRWPGSRPTWTSRSGLSATATPSSPTPSPSPRG